MKIDIATCLGAVARTVSHREHHGRPARAVAASRTYDTHADDLWDAITNPERLPRWFLPVSGDLRAGGRYQLEENAGGEIRRCDRPRVLAVTWEYGGETSWLTVHLAEQPGGRTHLALEHLEHFDDQADTYGPGAAGVGWDLALVGLAEHIATGASVSPDEAAAWATSEEGRAFVHGSSGSWASASIAAGADPSAASEAAARTTAFYTGEA